MNDVIAWYSKNRPGYQEAHKRAQYDLYPILQDREGHYWKVMYTIDSLDTIMLTRLDNERMIAMFRLSDGEPMDGGDVSPDLVRFASYGEAKTLRVSHPPTGEVLMEEED